MPSITRFNSTPDEDPLASFFESVSELTERIKHSLETGFVEVALHGEVANVTRARSGHVYFTVRDDLASIRAVMWKNDSRRLAFELTDGLAVRSLGRVTVYAPRGDYQIVVRQIEPAGMGTLELAFRQRYARLFQEGLFEPSRKRALPRYPQCVAIVTSPIGAAVRDLLQVINRRWRCVQVLIVPTRVQGAGAHQEVVAAVELANRLACADVIVIARGGGSQENLWTFNEDIVVRAIAGSRLPVVSAVGHEVDVTLADLAADKRALTPTEAGEFCVPDAREILLHLDRLVDRLRVASAMRLRNARTRIDQLAERARRALERDLVSRRHRLSQLAASIEALSPLGVLARGYSMTFQADGETVLREIQQVQTGDLLHTQLASGRISSRVV
jgi:exodeoxyribonuclease VII large subunit